MKPIAITMGDPSGISAEITIKKWNQRKKKKINPFFLIDCEKRVLKIFFIVSLSNCSVLRIFNCNSPSFSNFLIFLFVSLQTYVLHQ